MTSFMEELRETYTSTVFLFLHYAAVKFWKERK